MHGRFNILEMKNMIEQLVSIGLAARIVQDQSRALAETIRDELLRAKAIPVERVGYGVDRDE